MALAAEVKTLIVDVKPTIEVSAENGLVLVRTEGPLAQDSQLFDMLKEIRKSIPGVRGINLVAESIKKGRPSVPSRKGPKSTRDITRTFFTDL
jgi:hypothetical protein